MPTAPSQDGRPFLGFAALQVPVWEMKIRTISQTAVVRRGSGEGEDAGGREAVVDTLHCMVSSQQTLTALINNY